MLSKLFCFLQKPQERLFSLVRLLKFNLHSLVCFLDRSILVIKFVIFVYKLLVVLESHVALHLLDSVEFVSVALELFGYLLKDLVELNRLLLPFFGCLLVVLASLWVDRVGWCFTCIMNDGLVS